MSILHRFFSVQKKLSKEQETQNYQADLEKKIELKMKKIIEIKVTAKKYCLQSINILGNEISVKLAFWIFSLFVCGISISVIPCHFSQAPTFQISWVIQAFKALLEIPDVPTLDLISEENNQNKELVSVSRGLSTTALKN